MDFISKLKEYMFNQNNRKSDTDTSTVEDYMFNSSYTNNTSNTVKSAIEYMFNQNVSDNKNVKELQTYIDKTTDKRINFFDTVEGDKLLTELEKLYKKPKNEIRFKIEDYIKKNNITLNEEPPKILTLELIENALKDEQQLKTPIIEEPSPSTGTIDLDKNRGQVKFDLDLSPIEKEREILKQKQKSLLSLAKKYKQLEDLHRKATEKYTKELTDLLPKTVLLASKTVLNTLVDDDFPEKLKEAIEYLPSTALDTGINKLVRGYAVARANGVDTANLSMFDLMAMADNPDLAVNVPEEILRNANLYANFVGNVYKAKLGHYKYLKDIVEAEKQSLENDINVELQVYKTILDELNYKFNIQKTEKTLEMNKEKTDLLKKQLELKEKELEQREQLKNLLSIDPNKAYGLNDNNKEE